MGPLKYAGSRVSQVRRGIAKELDSRSALVSIPLESPMTLPSKSFRELTVRRRLQGLILLIVGLWLPPLAAQTPHQAAMVVVDEQARALKRAATEKASPQTSAVVNTANYVATNLVLLGFRQEGDLIRRAIDTANVMILSSEVSLLGLSNTIYMAAAGDSGPEVSAYLGKLPANDFRVRSVRMYRGLGLIRSGQVSAGVQDLAAAAKGDQAGFEYSPTWSYVAWMAKCNPSELARFAKRQLDDELTEPVARIRALAIAAHWLAKAGDQDGAQLIADIVERSLLPQIDPAEVIEAVLMLRNIQLTSRDRDTQDRGASGYRRIERAARVEREQGERAKADLTIMHLAKARAAVGEFDNANDLLERIQEGWMRQAVLNEIVRQRVLRGQDVTQDLDRFPPGVPRPYTDAMARLKRALGQSPAAGIEEYLPCK